MPPVGASPATSSSSRVFYHNQLSPKLLLSAIMAMAQSSSASQQTCRRLPEEAGPSSHHRPELIKIANVVVHPTLESIDLVRSFNPHFVKMNWNATTYVLDRKISTAFFGEEKRKLYSLFGSSCWFSYAMLLGRVAVEVHVFHHEAKEKELNEKYGRTVPAPDEEDSKEEVKDEEYLELKVVAEEGGALKK